MLSPGNRKHIASASNSGSGQAPPTRALQWAFARIWPADANGYTSGDTGRSWTGPNGELGEFSRWAAKSEPPRPAPSRIDPIVTLPATLATRRLNGRAVALILCGMLRAIDDENVDLILLRLQHEPELFLQRREQ
jgi:hypothetical protein